MKTYLVFYNLNNRNERRFSNPNPMRVPCHINRKYIGFFFVCFIFKPEATLQETENKVVMSEGGF